MSDPVDLLFDIGNTRLKWGLYQRGHIAQSGSVTHESLRETGFAALTTKLPRAVNRIVASNVAGASFATRLSAAVGLHCSGMIHFVHAERRACGVTSAYAQARRLGVDRWVAMIAAYAERHSAAVVVDAGTAITIDVVDKTGQHLGGQIIPGIGLMISSLNHATADLPSIGRGRRQKKTGMDMFAGNTGGAIINGANNAACGAIERAVRSVRSARMRPRIVLTGGDASSILKQLDGDIEHRPNLVLQGLARIIDSES
jgi:type III pantothenate kinase